MMGPSSDNEAAGPSTKSPMPMDADDQRDEEGAPRYPIPPRQLSAVEIPAVVENIDRAVKALGRHATLEHVS